MSFPLILLAFSTAAAHAVSAVQREASIFGLVMEDATFADAQRILGPAEVRHKGGDAAGSAYLSCYVGSDGVALVLSRTSEQSPDAITSKTRSGAFVIATARLSGTHLRGSRSVSSRGGWRRSGLSTRA